MANLVKHNKTNKVFEVGEMTEVSVILTDVDTKEVKEIKVTTFEKNYSPVPQEAEVTEVTEEVTETVTANTEETATQEVTPEQKVTEADLHIVKGVIADTKAIESHVALISQCYPEPMDTPASIVELTRMRDNARQCYKENEVRLKNTITTYPDDTKMQLTYLEKMVHYYTIYFTAKLALAELRKVIALTEKVAVGETKEEGEEKA